MLENLPHFTKLWENYSVRKYYLPSCVYQAYTQVGRFNGLSGFSFPGRFNSHSFLWNWLCRKMNMKKAGRSSILKVNRLYHQFLFYYLFKKYFYYLLFNRNLPFLFHHEICKKNTLPLYLLLFYDPIPSLFKKGSCRNGSMCNEPSLNHLL